MGIKNKTELFITKSLLIHFNKFDYSLTNYVKSINKVKIICPIHGIFEQTPNDHLKGQGCSKCSGKNKLTKFEFINRSNKIHENKYDYSLVDYINNKTKVKILCPIHGEFEQIPKNHMNGHICSKCSGNVNLTNGEFITRAKTIHGNKYDYSLTEYQSSNIKVIIICPEHGEFEQEANSHLRGCGCSKCDLDNRLGKLKMDTDDFTKKAKTIHGDKYKYDKIKYNGCYDYVQIECTVHGWFKQIAAYHLNGNGCPICRESKGEKEIRKYLTENNIQFIRQYKFTDCKNKRVLPFDFYLPDYNTCIEFDGKQHFEAVKRFGGIKGFESTKENDKIKTQYCQNNKIKLLRISYKEIIYNKLKQI
jgi:hypothetical protein